MPQEFEIDMKKSTQIVEGVYQEHIAKFGEPSSSVRYDNPPSNNSEIYPSFIDVMVWQPEEDVNMTTFSTIGMSEKSMQGAEHRAELHFSVEGTVDEELASEITMFMANVSLYPFMNATFFDWWYTLPNVNENPGFPSAGGLLLHPAFVEDGWDLICTDEGQVKIINLVPITKEEHALSKEQGIDSMLDYMDEHEISFFKQR